MTARPPAIFQETRDIVLASASPRRLELLGSLGLRFEVQPSRAEEPAPKPGEEPAAYALRMAGLKTLEVAARFPHAVVLGADTVVAVREDDGGPGHDAGIEHILGKPSDEADARRMLGLLAGRTHAVVTGCVLAIPGREPVAFAVSTAVTMGAYSAETLAAYAATGEPLDKAGAYAIQGRGAFLVTRVEGSYTNVVGLPLGEVVKVLLEWDVILPGQG
ncbi:Septum formation protein Maf [Desulfovibrio sp. X2]|uniref:Maf family protein n=1 Tax=Desulfovibrio sp. X2 TaxID=941449 RepID=UPI000358A619|nr:Maf family protein [Desulfovibrio sp. X2]EPR37050.1 Septum formation protein Maf [Desulfovibrio sp. X2]